MTPRTRTLMAALCGVLFTLAVAAQDPTADDLRKAIANLGSGRFAVREKASKTLWDAGPAAEPFLKEAVNSTDAEVAKRARAILDKFQSGVYPDTPPAVLKAIDAFKAAADPNARQLVARDLMRSGKHGCLALRQLLRRVDEGPEKQQLYARLSVEARQAVPGLLGQGDRAGAEELLELGMMGTSEDSFADFAVFQFLAGKLDAAVARYESLRGKEQGDELRRVAKVLTYLYRVKGDFAAATKAAKQSEDPALADAVMWEASDWKGLADHGFVGRSASGNDRGVRIAYARLAGDAKRHKQLVDEAKEAAAGKEGEPDELREVVESLLLNGHAEEAVAILGDREKELAMLFDLLCARMRHKEAFTLADAARRRDATPEDKNALELRRARMLHLLGDRGSASQLFGRLAESLLQTADDARDVRDLVRVEARIGRTAEAREHAALAMESLTKRERRDNFRLLLDPLFADRVEAAETLWWELRGLAPNEPGVATMKKLGDLLDGTAGADLIAVARGIGEKGTRPEVARLIVVGEVYAAAKQPDEAERWFRRAADKGGGVGWVRLGDIAAARKDFRTAAEHYGQAWQANKTAPLPLFLRGLALLQDGDEKEGRRLIELAHWLPLGNDFQRCELAEELAKRGFVEAARGEAELIMKVGWYRSWKVGNVLAQAAKWAIGDKDYGRAADLYERGTVGLMRTGATFIEASAYLTVPLSSRIYRARALVAAGKSAEAMPMIDEALKLLPGNIDLAIAVVPELEKAGMRADADRVFDAVAGAYATMTADYPDSAWGHNSAAWLRANCKRELDKAQAHAEKAVKLEPKNPGYLDTLAEVHFRKGDRAKALEMMKKCVELDGKNPYFRKQLVRFEKGDPDSATPDEDD